VQILLFSAGHTPNVILFTLEQLQHVKHYFIKRKRKRRICTDCQYWIGGDWCNGCEGEERERACGGESDGGVKKAVVLQTGDITVASRCMGMSELSAAGKFLESGVEARKTVRRKGCECVVS